MRSAVPQAQTFASLDYAPRDWQPRELRTSDCNVAARVSR
jgi:hypothetical protein